MQSVDKKDNDNFERIEGILQTPNVLQRAGERKKNKQITSTDAYIPQTEGRSNNVKTKPFNIHIISAWVMWG